MNLKILVAVVVVVAIMGSFFLFTGARAAGPGTSDTIVAAAADETEAKSAAESQFRSEVSSLPSDANVSVTLTDAGNQYWKASATYGVTTKEYWVPKEKPLDQRVQVGQSQTYLMTMTMPGFESLGGSSSSEIEMTIAFSVKEQTTHEGTPVYKIEISGSGTIMGITVPYDGCLYIDTESYEARYIVLNTTVSAMGQTQDMTIEYFFNYSTNKLRVKMTVNGSTMADTETDMLKTSFGQYNVQTFLGDNIYVGWTDNFELQSGSSSYTVTLTVTKEETITVPAGTFRCYVISMSSENILGTDITGNLWVNAQMTLVPKMEFDVSVLGTTTTMNMTLQSYSGY